MRTEIGAWILFPLCVKISAVRASRVIYMLEPGASSVVTQLPGGDADPGELLSLGDSGVDLDAGFRELP